VPPGNGPHWRGGVATIAAERPAHNLITFKSHQEALDDWALKELTGHYVNYRKQVSPSLQQLLPEEEFRASGLRLRIITRLFGVT
jgi:hypothetical protein